MHLKKIWKLLSIIICFSLLMPSAAFATFETETQTESSSEMRNTESDTEADTDIETEPITESESETESETESESNPGKIVINEPIIGEPETESESEPGANTIQYGSNEELINAQEIITPPEIKETFRFATVEKEYALAKVDNMLIYEEKDDTSREVGRMRKNSICYILEKDEDWYYIESGEVRGFVLKKDLIKGKKAKKYIKKVSEENLMTAKALVEPIDNKALTYTKTTAYDAIVDKVYAFSKEEELNIREGIYEDSRIIGTLKKDSTCYILAEVDDDWVFVESEDVRGFVKAEYLVKGKAAERKRKKMTKEDVEFTYAEELIPVEENAACYYTLTSVKEGAVSSAIRDSMLKFASQFLGNAYVWGGTSLTNGADCSGFVQSVYAEYGYSLPRVAEDQAMYGTKIPVADALPGDLIFYARDGYIYHVVMYIGDGKTLEAQSSRTGIVNSTVNMTNAVWATRIISDEDTGVINEINSKYGDILYTEASQADYGKLLGNFKLTAYCSCSTCCGVWSGGPTASGAMPVAGRTVAMAGVPFGTKLIINGQIYTVEDRGTPYGHVDIYMNDHNEAAIHGVQYASVYLAN